MMKGWWLVDIIHFSVVKWFESCYALWANFISCILIWTTMRRELQVCVSHLNRRWRVVKIPYNNKLMLGSTFSKTLAGSCTAQQEKCSHGSVVKWSNTVSLNLPQSHAITNFANKYNRRTLWWHLHLYLNVNFATNESITMSHLFSCEITSV